MSLTMNQIYCVRMSGVVIQELFHSEIEVLCLYSCHGCCDRSDYREYGFIYHLCVVLTNVDTLFYCFMLVEVRAGMTGLENICCVFAILTHRSWMWQMFWFGWEVMTKTVTVICDLVGHL